MGNTFTSNPHQMSSSVYQTQSSCEGLTDSDVSPMMQHRSNNTLMMSKEMSPAGLSGKEY